MAKYIYIYIYIHTGASTGLVGASFCALILISHLYAHHMYCVMNWLTFKKTHQLISTKLDTSFRPIKGNCELWPSGK